MQHKTRHEAYLAFVDFIRKESQHERRAVNQRMLSVLLWCFVFPAVATGILLGLARLGVVPSAVRFYGEWLFLVFPISYSIYFLTAEVLHDVPTAFRQGGMVASLRQCQTEGAWRERVVETMRRQLGASKDGASKEEWLWIVSSFRMDLATMKYRTRFLTALAGAVFFIITKGLDMLGDEPENVTWIRDQVMGWVEITPSEGSQWAGLVLFLVLLYLSGSQNYTSLSRYLNCAELALQEDHPEVFLNHRTD